MIAVLEIMTDHLVRTLQGGLAVVGAAIVGGLGIGGVSNIVGKFFFGKAMPAFFLRVIRLLGGATSGLIVSYIVFGNGGGWGLGGGMGPGEGGTTPQPAMLAAKKGAAKPVAAPLRVALLGGARVTGEAFYQLENEAKPRTLVELQKLLADAREAGGAPAKLEILIYEDSVAESHAAVVELKNWAEQNGYAVSTEKKLGVYSDPAKGDRP